MTINSCCNHPISPIGSKNIKIDSINVEEVAMDTTENTSGVGFSGVCGDSLFFYDAIYGYFYKLSTNGKIGSRKMGLGHAKGEIPAKVEFVSYCQQTNQLICLGGTNDVYIYDEQENVTKRVGIRSCGIDGTYTSSKSYSTWDEIIMTCDNENIYYTIMGEADGTRFYEEEDYFEKAAIIMKTNVLLGTEEPIGHYSDFYVTNKNSIRHFPHIYFDVETDGSFYVTYQADSLIYHFDKDFNVITIFGYKGKGMDTEYSTSGVGVESVSKAIEKDYEKVGMYYWIKRTMGILLEVIRKMD